MWDKILTNEIVLMRIDYEQTKLRCNFQNLRRVCDVLTWTAKGSQKKSEIIQRKNTWGQMVMIITSWYRWWHRWPLNCQKKSDLRQRQRPGGGCYHNVTSGCIHEQVFDDDDDDDRVDDFWHNPIGANLGPRRVDIWRASWVPAILLNFKICF